MAGHVPGLRLVVKGYAAKCAVAGPFHDVGVGVRPIDGIVEIAVTDQGIGIAEADQQRIFERFYRAHQARSRRTGGTGLGLAIVKHVAQRHDGEVRVWSQPGRGSTFTLRIPEGGPATPPQNRSNLS
mgnify:CR=1 FL=1